LKTTPMILLIGGTSETAFLASALAGAGFDVLVSTATDVPLALGGHPKVTRRVGALDLAGLLRLANECGVRLIVDASHPYATSVRSNARRAAAQLKIPYVSWVRPRVLDEDEDVIFGENHRLAAEAACSFHVPVLLTIGSRNLTPYVSAAKQAGVELIARVLLHPSSLEACHRAGIQESNIIVGRGPFSLEENLAVLRRFNIGVIVTKDSGVAGGVPAKIEAARLHGCRVVVVQRPKEPGGLAFSDVAALVTAVHRAIRYAEY